MVRASAPLQNAEKVDKVDSVTYTVYFRCAEKYVLRGT